MNLHHDQTTIPTANPTSCKTPTTRPLKYPSPSDHDRGISEYETKNKHRRSDRVALLSPQRKLNLDSRHNIYVRKVYSSPERGEGGEGREMRVGRKAGGESVLEAQWF